MQAKAADHAAAGTGDKRVVAVLLAGEDVTHVHLYLGSRHSQQRIAQGNRGVAVAAEVHYQAVGRETRTLYLVDELTFHIALIKAYLHLGEMPAQSVKILFHGRGAVNLKLATPCEVKVGTVDNLYAFHLLSR